VSGGGGRWTTFVAQPTATTGAEKCSGVGCVGYGPAHGGNGTVVVTTTTAVGQKPTAGGGGSGVVTAGAVRLGERVVEGLVAAVVGRVVVGLIWL
jgi:hypothetical protein